MMRRIYCSILVLAVCSLFATPAQAQWALGGSYEIRNQNPQNGYGGRIEKTIGLPVPLIDLAVRGHFSYFNEENSVTLKPTNQNEPVEYTNGEEITDFDFGLTLLGHVKLGMVKPYVGVGVGGNTAKISYNEDVQTLDLPDDDKEKRLAGDSKSKLAYYGLIGGEFSIIPLLNPFVEYRLSDYSGSLDLEGVQSNVQESNGRLVFGVTLRF